VAGRRFKSIFKICFALDIGAAGKFLSNQLGHRQASSSKKEIENSEFQNIRSILASGSREVTIRTDSGKPIIKDFMIIEGG
jgi:hypothetical protein